MLRLLSAYSVLTCSTIQANGNVIRICGFAPVSKYHLKYAVLEGGLPFNKAYGMNVVDYIDRDDRLGSVFNDSMKEFNLIFKKEIMDIYTGLKGLRTLVDVGGGVGTIPNYDLPLVVEKSPSHPGIEHIAGDMFVRIPKDDAIFMKNCYKALPDNGKVIVVDMRIKRELQSLAKAARFSDIRVACSAFTFSVVELLKNM
ncbi:hypothetical protein ACFXTH_015007 [Malus domestica]